MSAVLCPRPLRGWLTGLLFGLATICAPLGARGDVLEIHELDANPEPLLNQSVTVRGRLQSAGGGHLQLVGSPVDFRYTESRVPIRPGTTHVELDGRLDRDGQNLVLHIESLRAVPSEAQDFAAHRTKIPADNFEALYELSRWARARAKWYDDAKLRELASQSYRQAFAREEAALVSHRKLEGLLELAERGEQLGLELPEVLRIRYRALALKRAQLRGGDAAAWQKLADKMAELLPAADRVAAVEVPRADDLSPDALLAAYRQADSTHRQAMHRALWGAVAARVFELRAEEHANLLELAREARATLPEREDLAHQLELTGWRRAAEHPEKLSREALIATRNGLLRLEQSDEARSVVEHWLRLRRDELAADEAEDRIQLADDYLELAGDRLLAAELLREAVAIVPDFAAAAQGLRRLGYEQIGGVWREASGLNDPSQPATASLGPGTTEAEVLRRLRPPDHITRTATRRGIIEQWNYAGPPALLIYLHRDTAGGGATVTRLVSGD